MPNVKLLDGKRIKFDNSIDGFELSKKISKSLEKAALVMEVDGQLKDLSFKIRKDSLREKILKNQALKIKRKNLVLQIIQNILTKNLLMT